MKLNGRPGKNWTVVLYALDGSEEFAMVSEFDAPTEDEAVEWALARCPEFSFAEPGELIVWAD